MSAPPRNPRWLLRRADQIAVASLVVVALATMIGWWLSQGGWQGRLVEIDRAEPLVAQFELDINSADWPELIQLPGIGETLARRIVASREADGPFADNDALCRVNGIGPKTLDRIRPYLRPMPNAENVAGK